MAATSQSRMLMLQDSTHTLQYCVAEEETAHLPRPAVGYSSEGRSNTIRVPISFTERSAFDMWDQQRGTCLIIEKENMNDHFISAGDTISGSPDGTGGVEGPIKASLGMEALEWSYPEQCMV
uniref:Uncharacterized protein n=1 Tax=Sphaerodactylus townsendi TaxID=933632 RepID=A0ACB8F2K0_9SAUR